MATRAEQARADQEQRNSERNRSGRDERVPSAGERLRAATAASAKGRALHGPTKQIADAKALKPNPGRIEDFWRTGINGGEDQTINAVLVGRGADGHASIHKASRKSTRGEWPGGEKDGQLPRARKRLTHSPEARAARGK